MGLSDHSESGSFSPFPLVFRWGLPLFTFDNHEITLHVTPDTGLHPSPGDKFPLTGQGPPFSLREYGSGHKEGILWWSTRTSPGPHTQDHKDPHSHPSSQVVS